MLIYTQKNSIFTCIGVLNTKKKKHVQKIFLLRHVKMILNMRFHTKNKEKQAKMVNSKIVKDQSRWSKISIYIYIH